MSDNANQTNPDTAAKPSPAKASKPKMDRRIYRTREALGDAFIELMLQQPFESITVQHVLDRAGVSRSTFYSHYSDKDDLFISDVEDFWKLTATMLERANDKSDRVAPVRELFAHISDAKDFIAALSASGRMHDVMKLGEGELARGIERRLAASAKAQSLAKERRAAIAHAQSGALFSLLAWWIDHGQHETPAEMDDLLHKMFWAGVGT